MDWHGDGPSGTGLAESVSLLMTAGQHYFKPSTSDVQDLKRLATDMYSDCVDQVEHAGGAALGAGMLKVREFSGGS